MTIHLTIDKIEQCYQCYKHDDYRFITSTINPTSAKMMIRWFTTILNNQLWKTNVSTNQCVTLLKLIYNDYGLTRTQEVYSTLLISLDYRLRKHNEPKITARSAIAKQLADLVELDLQKNTP